MGCQHPGKLEKQGNTTICPRCKQVIYRDRRDQDANGLSGRD